MTKDILDHILELAQHPAYSGWALGSLISEIAYVAYQSSDLTYLTNEQFNQTLVEMLIEVKRTGQVYEM